MKRALLALALLVLVPLARADLPASGAISMDDVRRVFIPGGVGIDQGGFVSGTSGGVTGYRRSPAVGSISSAYGVWGGVTVDGKTIEEVSTNGSQVLTVRVSGFSADPGLTGWTDYFGTVECSVGGVQVLSLVDSFDASSYAYSIGQATWQFTNGIITVVNNIPSGSLCYFGAKNYTGALGAAPLSSYYRGGSLVPNIGKNAAIPTSGQISLSQFYGAGQP
jgi:hypothetical protein